MRGYYLLDLTDWVACDVVCRLFGKGVLRPSGFWVKLGVGF